MFTKVIRTAFPALTLSASFDHEAPADSMTVIRIRPRRTG